MCSVAYNCLARLPFLKTAVPAEPMFKAMTHSVFVWNIISQSHGEFSQ
jgi:hypothetical protein